MANPVTRKTLTGINSLGGQPTVKSVSQSMTEISTQPKSDEAGTRPPGHAERFEQVRNAAYGGIRSRSQIEKFDSIAKANGANNDYAPMGRP